MRSTRGGAGRKFLGNRWERLTLRIEVGGIGIHGPQPDPAGSDEDRSRCCDSGQNTHRRLGEHTDTHADHGSDNHRPYEPADGRPENCGIHGAQQ